MTIATETLITSDDDHAMNGKYYEAQILGINEDSNCRMCSESKARCLCIERTNSDTNGV